MGRRTVAVGQRYETVGAPWLVWEVVEIVKDWGGLHARLQRVDDPLTRKTVSVAALHHRASYRLVMTGDDPPEAAGP